MDQTLAAIYGTPQVSEEDVEKTAAAELAEKLASGEAELDEATLEALANEVLAAEAEETQVEEPAEQTEETVEAAPETEEAPAVEEPAEKTAKAEEKKEEKEEAKEEKKEKKAESEETEPELTEEQQKIAEADYLGRVMAHAFAQESREIEKQAGSKDEEKEYKRLAKGHGRVAAAVGGINGAIQGGVMGGLKGGKKGAVAGAVGGAAVGGGVGYASGRANHWVAGKVGPKRDSEKTKKSSAMETLIMQRAAELCQENGVDPAVLTQEPEKQADAETVNPYDVLASKVEEGAWELLKAKGLVEEAPAEEPKQE